MVFLPSTRYGSFSVETSYQPSRSLRSATYFPQSEISPFSFTTFAPKAWHSITLATRVSAGDPTYPRTPPPRPSRGPPRRAPSPAPPAPSPPPAANAASAAVAPRPTQPQPLD